MNFCKGNEINTATTVAASVLSPLAELFNKFVEAAKVGIFAGYGYEGKKCSSGTTACSRFHELGSVMLVTAATQD